MAINMIKWPVAAEACSGWICAMCGHNLTKRETLEVGRSLENCPACAAPILAAEMPAKLLPDAKRFIEPESVKQTSWFHATLSRNWHADVAPDSIPVHVGTYAAALMRSRDLRDLDEIGHLDDTEWIVYEVSVDATAPVMEDVHMDSDGAWPETLDEMVILTKGCDVVRYLNRYEDPGSVSLLVNAATLRVVSTRRFRADEIDLEMAKIYL